MSHSLQMHYQNKMQQAFLFVEPVLDINMHDCLVVTQLSRLENKGPSPTGHLRLKGKTSTGQKDTGRVTGHSYNHGTTIKIIGSNFCSVAKQPGLHSGQHLRWLRLLKEAGQSEVTLALLRLPQSRVN